MARYDTSTLLDLLNVKKIVPGTEYTERQGIRTSDLQAGLEEALEEAGVKAQVVRGVSRARAYQCFVLEIDDPAEFEKLKSVKALLKEKTGVLDISFESPRTQRYSQKKAVRIVMVTRRDVDLNLSSLFLRAPFGSRYLYVSLGTSSALPLITDITQGLIIAGGKDEKDNLIDTVLMTLICTTSPNDLEMILAGDHKNFERYRGIPHLKDDIVNDPQTAETVFGKLRAELERRRNLFSESGTRSIVDYNSRCEFFNAKELPSILLMIDEADDFVNGRFKEYHEFLNELILDGSTAGICIVYATEKIREDVLDKQTRALIKNRAVFKTATVEESRLVMDLDGAERLVGGGDMYYSAPDRTIRVHSVNVKTEEIDRVAQYLRDNYKDGKLMCGRSEEEDEMLIYEKIVEFVRRRGIINVYMIDRHFGLGVEKSKQFIERLGRDGYVEIEGEGPYMRGKAKDEENRRRRK